MPKKSTTPTGGTDDPDPHDYVSLNPRNYDPPEPEEQADSGSGGPGSFNLAALRTYTPAGEPTDVLRLTGVPMYLHSILLLLAADARTSHGKCAMFCLARGLGLLMPLPEIQAIRRHYQAIQRRAPVDVVEQLRWSYALSGKGGKANLYLKCISPDDTKRCAAVAGQLGMSTVTFAILAIAAGVIDAPLGGDHKRLLFAELADFYAALGNRAAFVGDVHKRAMAAPPAAPFDVSWSDVVKGRK